MRGPPNHHSSPPKIMCVPGMLPTMAGPAPWPTSQQIVNDCGATMRPNRRLRGEHVVVVERVGVLHALHPTADVVHRDRLFELPTADGLAEMTVDVRRVQRDPRLLDLGHVPLLPLARPRRLRRHAPALYDRHVRSTTGGPQSGKD